MVHSSIVHIGGREDCQSNYSWMKANAFLPCNTLTNIRTITPGSCPNQPQTDRWVSKHCKWLAKGHQGQVVLLHFPVMVLTGRLTKERQNLWDGLQFGRKFTVFESEHDLTWRKSKRWANVGHGFSISARLQFHILLTDCWMYVLGHQCYGQLHLRRSQGYLLTSKYK